MSSDVVRMVSRRDGPPPLWSTCTGDVMAIHGEVDISTCDLFAKMVQGATGRAEGGGARHEVYVDLGDLDFIDVSGARVLVTAGAGRGPGCQFVICRPPAQLARILDVGWGPLAGLRLEADEATGHADCVTGGVAGAAAEPAATPAEIDDFMAPNVAAMVCGGGS